MKLSLSLRIFWRLCLSVCWLPGISQDLETLVGQKPFALNGSVQVATGLYTATGMEARGQRFPYQLSGNLDFQIYGMSVPLSFVYGSQNRDIRQPFNQFGASPTYKWITVHAGYRNVQFSPFTLAGHTYLGGGLELNPGKFRFAAIYGKFNQAVEGNLANPDQVPTFRRSGFAVRVGYGTEQNHLDLSLLRAADDVGSINADSAGRQQVLPGENGVIGVSSRFTLFRKLSVETELATSAYTLDVGSEKTAAPKKWPRQLLSGIIHSRNSTKYFSALQAGVNYKFLPAAGLRLQYRRIDPGYRTMGAYYFQNDLASYTLAPYFLLWKNKVNVNGSFGYQYDNLRHQKQARTDRLVTSANVSLNPNANWGLDLRYSNFGISQRAGFRPITDTLRLAQNNLSYSGNLRYSVQQAGRGHTFTLLTLFQELQDFNPKTTGTTGNRNYVTNAGYFLQLDSLAFSLNVSLNLTINRLATGQAVRYYGPSVGVGKGWLDKKLSLDTSLSYLINAQTGAPGGRVLNTNLTLSYRLRDKQLLGFQWMLNQSTGTQAWLENRLTLNYGLTF